MEQGDDVVEYKQRRDDGKEHRHQGRSDKHEGHDRRSGTGRGRGQKKEGHGKGNWGKDDDVKKDEPTAEGAEGEEKKDEEAKPVEEKKPEPKEETEYDKEKRRIREEEEKVKTLDDYLATRKTAGLKAQMREVEKFAEKNVTEGGNLQDARVTSKKSNVLLYNAGQGKTQETELLGFQAGADDDFEDDRRGGRGGRGRGRGNRGGDRQEAGRKGPRGGKMKFGDDDFPTLS